MAKVYNYLTACHGSLTDHTFNFDHVFKVLQKAACQKKKNNNNFTHFNFESPYINSSSHFVFLYPGRLLFGLMHIAYNQAILSEDIGDNLIIAEIGEESFSDKE